MNESGLENAELNQFAHEWVANSWFDYDENGRQTMCFLVGVDYNEMKKFKESQRVAI